MIRLGNSVLCCALALGCASTSMSVKEKDSKYEAVAVDMKQTNEDAGLTGRDKKLNAAAKSSGTKAIDFEDILTQLSRGARVYPSYKGDTFEGFKIAGVRPNSIYVRYGVKNGDVLKRINGLTLDNVNRLLEAYGSVQQAKFAEVELLRNDQPITLRIKLPLIH